MRFPFSSSDLSEFSQESLASCKVSFVNWISQSAKVAGKEFENEQHIALADVGTLKEQYKIVQEMCSEHQVRIKQVFRYEAEYINLSAKHS